MNYIIYNGEIRAINYIIRYSYVKKTELGKETIRGEKYITINDDYKGTLRKLEFEFSKYQDVNLSVEAIDCYNVLNFNGIKASSYQEAENIIKNLTLEEQLIETQFQLDSLIFGLSE